jgi:hypothetical protein
MLKTAVSADKMYLTGIDLENRGRLLKDEELLAKLKPELRCFSNLTMRIS